MKSEAINELAAALAKAQAGFTKIVKNTVNPYFKSKYADLDAIREGTVPALSANGLAVTQLAGWDDGRVSVITMLLHSSGQYIQAEMSMKPTKDDPQGVGSCLTYLRRYAYSSLLMCTADTDDDGNGAHGQEAPKPTPAKDNLYHCSNEDKRWLVEECKKAQVLDIEMQKTINGLMEGKSRDFLPTLITDARKELGLEH